VTGAARPAPPMTREDAILEGHRSIEAALEARSRLVHRILAVRPGDRRLRRLRALAREAGVAIEAAGEADVAERAAGTTHGGVVAEVGPRRYVTLEELLTGAGPDPILFMLDGVEDPFTYGQAVRALYAAGAGGLIVPERTWESAAGLVARSSAGTSELLPTAQVESVREAATRCHEAGLHVVCAVTAPDAVPVAAVDLRRSTLVIIGGERRGITRSFRAECDARVEIRYARPQAPPLSAAAAAAVIGFEAYRQRTSTEQAFGFEQDPDGVGDRPG
jgi:23S rRNA (guanosine2251-2'-O)-methyltransferase